MAPRRESAIALPMQREDCEDLRSRFPADFPCSSAWRDENDDLSPAAGILTTGWGPPSRGLAKKLRKLRRSSVGDLTASIGKNDLLDPLPLRMPLPTSTSSKVPELLGEADLLQRMRSFRRSLHARHSKGTARALTSLRFSPAHGDIMV